MVLAGHTLEQHSTDLSVMQPLSTLPGILAVMRWPFVFAGVLVDCRTRVPHMCSCWAPAVCTFAGCVFGTRCQLSAAPFHATFV
jgi:hypothetical protein